MLVLDRHAFAPLLEVGRGLRRQQHVAAVKLILQQMVVARRACRVKRIDVRKVGRPAVQTPAVDAGVAVLADADRFPGQTDQPLDVELALVHPRDK